MPLSRPPFITEEAWEAATEAQQHDWYRYASDLAELAEDPRFRNVVGRWIDEISGLHAAALDLEECAIPGAETLMKLREGRRHVGIQIMKHWQAVAPKTWMRALHEMKNARTRADTEPPERLEE